MALILDISAETRREGEMDLGWGKMEVQRDIETEMQLQKEGVQNQKNCHMSSGKLKAESVDYLKPQRAGSSMRVINLVSQIEQLKQQQPNLNKKK